MNIKPIHTDVEYEAALEMMEQLWSADKGTPEYDQLELLSIVVEKYEESRFPIDAPDPVEAVLFYLEQNGLDRAELARVLGSRSRASEFLNRKTSLSINQVRKLNSEWHIPADVLIKPVVEEARCA